MRLDERLKNRTSELACRNAVATAYVVLAAPICVFIVLLCCLCAGRAPGSSGGWSEGASVTNSSDGSITNGAFGPAAPGVTARPNTTATTLKKGIIFSSAIEANAYKAYSSQLAFAYDYNPVWLTAGGVSFLPMRGYDWSAADFVSNATNAIRRGSPALLGQNEPNLNSQQTPSEAARFWIESYAPVLKKYPNITAVSPALAATPDALSWMQSFLKACTGCRVDAVSIHYYGSEMDMTKSIARLQAFVNRTADTFPGYSIWLTEFMSPNASNTMPYLRALVPWLQAHPRVARFSAFRTSLVVADLTSTAHRDYAAFVTSNGTLTALAKAYLAA